MTPIKYKHGIKYSHKYNQYTPSPQPHIHHPDTLVCLAFSIVFAARSSSRTSSVWNDRSSRMMYLLSLSSWKVSRPEMDCTRFFFLG